MMTTISPVSIPQLGFGTLLCGNDVTKASVLKALEVGYRHIDTAYVYQNEEPIGEALKEAFEKKIVSRQDLFITSKLPSNGHAKDRVLYFLKKSLSRLQLSYVDLYLVHFPQAFKYSTDDDTLTNDGKDFDYETTQMDTWRVMEECVDLGLVKNIGLSNYNSKQIKEIYDLARIKPCNLQVECHIYLQQQKLFKFCKDLGMSFTAYSPLGNPDSAANCFLDANRAKLLEEPMLAELAKKYNKTPAQVACRWLTQRGIIIIPKSQTPSRIEENFKCMDFSLTDEEMERIKSLDRNGRVFKFEFLPSLPKLPDFPFHEEF